MTAYYDVYKRFNFRHARAGARTSTHRSYVKQVVVIKVSKSFLENVFVRKIFKLPTILLSMRRLVAYTYYIHTRAHIYIYIYICIQRRRKNDIYSRAILQK